MSVLNHVRSNIDPLERKSMLSEKQVTKRASRETIEEIYTHDDIVTHSYNMDPNIGFPFDYPTRWLNDPSQDKRIAIRRLECTPSTHSFRLRVFCFDANDQLVSNISKRLDITAENDIIEVLHAFCDTFQPRNAQGQEVGELFFDYNPDTYEVNIMYIDANNQLGVVLIQGFAIMAAYNSVSDYRAAERDVMEFLMLMNQNLDVDGDAKYDENVHRLNNAPALQNQVYEQSLPLDSFLDWHLYPNFEKIFRRWFVRGAAGVNAISRVMGGVWNRKHLYYHASFSTSHRKYIGKNNDFYPVPNVLYPAPTNETSFHITFSQNGKKKLIIYYCNLDIHLTFISNVDECTAL